MLYIYRHRASTGARDLAEAITIQGLVARRTKGLALRTLAPIDRVVCWGSNFAATPNTVALNNVEPISKFQEAQVLREKGVRTVEVSRTRPAGAVAVARPAFEDHFYNVPAMPRTNVATATELVNTLHGFIAAERTRRTAWERLPAPVAAQTWLPRRNNHVGGADLLAENLVEVDYYSKKENITEEYRLHMFNGKSIRAGKKIQRDTRPDGRTPAHPWIRAFDGGWIIAYDGFESTKAMRELAASALKALDLDFGAVDIGKLADGNLIVLEVNRAPGVEGGTVEAYAKHIIAWARA